MKPITIWSRLTVSGKLEHNHIEDGHVSLTEPAPKFPAQEKAWKGGGWFKQFAYLSNNKVVQIGEYV